jgi:hypothetical protein
MAATQVQKATNTSAGAATLAVGSAQGWAAPTAGNVLVAWANANITMTLSGWTAGPSVVDGNGAYMWYKSAAGTETTITFSAGSSVDPITVGVLEYSGISTPRDVQNSASVTATNGTSTPSVSATGTNSIGDLWVCIGAIHGGSAGTSPTWTNSFVNQQTVQAGTSGSAGFCQTFVGEFQNTSAATVSTVVSWSTGSLLDRQALLMAFPIAAAAPTHGTPAISLVGSVGASSNTAGSFGPLSSPGTLLPGDFVVVCAVQNQTTAMTFTGAGWSTLSSAVNATGLYAPLVLYKVWAPGDVMPTVTSTTGKWAYATMAFRADVGVLALDQSATGTGQTTAGTTLAPPSVTSARPGVVSIALFAGRNSTAVATANNTTPPTNYLEGSTPSVSDASTNAGTTAALQQVSVEISYRLGQTGTIAPGTATFSQSSFHTAYQITAYATALGDYIGWGSQVNL